MSELEHISSVQARLGEGPLWDPAEGVLYFVDIEGDCYYRYTPATGRHERVDVGLPIGVMALRQNGGLVLATRDGFAFWDAAARRLTPIADPEADKPQARFNDGAVDAAGRFWAGTMGDGDQNSLYRLEADLSVHVMETGIGTANGIGWSPDRKTMYFTDSPRQVIYAYDFDLDSGNLSNRRPFVDSRGEWGFPDGLTVDSEGFVWSARWEGWKVTRYDPRGRVEREIRLPVERVTSCTFGGPNLDELYITTAWTSLDDKGRAQQPLAGDLFRVRVGIKGQPQLRFAA
ncbi:MAG: SMP-30/gluconolactonase/LRE family protein [Anaerolineae bacterium]